MRVSLQFVELHAAREVARSELDLVRAGVDDAVDDFGDYLARQIQDEKAYRFVNPVLNALQIFPLWSLKSLPLSSNPFMPVQPGQSSDLRATALPDHRRESGATTGRRRS